MQGRIDFATHARRAMVCGLVAAAVGVVSTPVSAAVTPSQKCQAGKAQASGKYYACLAKAEQALVLSGDSSARDAAATACLGKLEAAFAKLEASAVAAGSSCPSVGDLETVKTVLEGCSTAVSDKAAGESLPADLGSCNASLSACGNETLMPATNQSTCTDIGGSPISCATTGHDGEFQAGLPRSFIDNGDGTVTDQATGLTWEKFSDDDSIHDTDNGYNWDEAFDRIDALNDDAFAGHEDWRMPNAAEVLTLYDFGAPPSGPSTFPAFNTGCAPGCTVTTCSCPGFYPHGSGTTVQWDTRWAFGVTFDFFFGYGFGQAVHKNDPAAIRAVRGG